MTPPPFDYFLVSMCVTLVSGPAAGVQLDTATRSPCKQLLVMSDVFGQSVRLHN